MKIKLVKLDPKAVLPSKAHNIDAGFDMTAVEKYNDDFGNIVYDTKIAVNIPENYVGLLFPRSSVSKKTLSLSNSVGVVDAGYTGSVVFKFKPTPYFTQRADDESFDYEAGDRIGQLVILELPNVTFEEVKELPKTERGVGGYGSSGK